MSNEILILKDNLFTTEGGKAGLLISTCKDCNASVFPPKPFCCVCGGENVEDATIYGMGKLRAFTNVYHPSPESRMPVPYGMAVVEFPEHYIRITGLCTEHDVSKLSVGMDCKIVVEKVYEEDGKDVLMYKFQPVGEGA